ncbi:MAG: Crp/Fnr family transcriptional regulator [Candidatus Bipolaricaulia bacterium]
MLFCQDPCVLSGFAKALEDTQVVFIEKGRFLEFLERHPAVFRRLCEWLSREILIYQCKMAELAYEPMRVNLARLLIMLARSYGVPGEDGLEIEFSRNDLAELAGTHIDTIVRTLAQFKEKGLIATHYHKIKILDEEGLEAIASPLPTCLRENLF